MIYNKYSMNNYLFDLPNEIIDKIYYELHKIYMLKIKNTLYQNIFWYKIKKIHHLPITYINYYLSY